MQKKTALLVSICIINALLDAPSAGAAEVNCVQRKDLQGNETYFKLNLASEGTQGMSNTQIKKPTRFFTVDLPGGINYSKNRYGGMEFWSGICAY